MPASVLWDWVDRGAVLGEELAASLHATGRGAPACRGGGWRHLAARPRAGRRALLDGLAEAGGLQERLVGAGVEPGNAPAQHLQVQGVLVEMGPVHVGDPRARPGRRAWGSGDHIGRAWAPRPLLTALGPAPGSTRPYSLLGENGGAVAAGRHVLQKDGRAVAIRRTCSRKAPRARSRSALPGYRPAGASWPHTL